MIMSEKTILYSTNCPNCNMLEKKLKAAGIDFEVCTDMSIMKERHITSAPTLEMEGNRYTFYEANQMLRKMARGE